MRSSTRVVALALTTLLTSSACSYSKYIAVKPEQLPRLNGGTTAVLGQTHNATIVGVTVRRIESPDGRVHEIRGRFNLLVSERNEPQRFEHPVESAVSDTVLRVSGGNRGETHFDLDAIDYARVEVPDATKNLWGTVGIVVGVGLLGALVVVAATN